MNSKKFRKKFLSTLLIIAILLIVFIELMPIIVVFMNSFKRDIDIWARGPFYFSFNFDSYKSVLSNRDFLLSLRNSIIVAVVSTVISIIVGAMASYGITRYVFRSKKLIAYSFLIFRMIPQISLVIPLFMMFNQFQLRDTLTGIILSHMSFNIPYVVWLFITVFCSNSTRL